MRRVFLLCLVIILNVNFLCAYSYASSGGNTGVTGLWEYPTAEIPEDGSGLFGYTKATPYGHYFLDLAWLPWLEINARFTTFNSLNVSPTNSIGYKENVGGRRYMDKAIDLKAILWHSKDPQNWIVPSIAIGMFDILGTELSKAHYVTATWRYKNFAATLGWGSDRLNGTFGGIEWDITDWLTIKAEYSPLDYRQDRVGSARVLRDRDLPSSKYNAGIVLKAPWGLQGSVSYQRGNEWVFNISHRIDLKGPFLGAATKRYDAPSNARCPDWNQVDSEDLIMRIKSGLEQYTRVRDVELKLEDSEEGHRLTLSYENYGYASHAEAMTRILIVLAAVMPETDELVLIHKNASVPIVTATFPGTLLFDIRSRTLRDRGDPIHSAVFTWASKDVEDPDDIFLKRKAQHEFKTMFVYEPRIDQTLRKSYMDRFSIDAIYRGRYSNGWGSVIDVRFPLYNNVDTQDLEGIWWEKDLNNEIRLQQAGFTYANKFGKSNAWIFGEAGWLDEEFFGGNIWLRYYGKNGRWWIGGRLSAFHDRDPWSFAGLTDGRLRFRYGRVYDMTSYDEWRYSEWAQAGYNIAGLDVDLQADYGRFADEDKGWKFSVTRHWDDAALGFWYIKTNRTAPGKSYTKAGVHMELPMDKWFGSWFGSPSSHIWEQNTILHSSWRLHSGREGGIIRTPERMMSQLRPMSMKKNVEKLLIDYCSYGDEADESESSKEVTSILGYIFR